MEKPKSQITTQVIEKH